MPAQILIFGAGAVGAFYGALLAQSHIGSPSSSRPQVSVVCRSNYSKVASSGFHLTSPTYHDWSWKPAHVFSSAQAAIASDIKWDYIVITTKALPDVGDDSSLIDGLVSANTKVVLIQNGLGVEAPYLSRFPTAKILSAVTVVSAAQPSHGEIKHNRWTRISVGPYYGDNDNNSSSASDSDTDSFVAHLQAGGIKDAEAYSASKLQLLRWHKVALNAAMNPSSVLTDGSPNGAMALDDDLAAHLLGVMNEVLSAALVVCGVKELPASFASADKILASTRRNTSGSRPSMWADWESGKAMELEVIMGNPIRMARKKGIGMPRLESMYALLKMRQRNRDKAAANDHDRGNSSSKL